MVRYIVLICLAGAVSGMPWFAAAARAGTAAPVPTKYLLLDARIIDDAQTRDVKLAVGTVVKHPGNPLFKEELAWEPRFDNLYANVFHDADDGLYKCWYSPFIIDKPTSTTPREKRGEISYLQAARPLRNDPLWRQMGVCYAVSKDGLRWEKPLMDVHKFDGQQSNIVAAGPHGAGIFKDSPQREKNPDRRYKMFFKARDMAVAFSPDGLHWSNPVQCPQIKARGDTHNNAFWAPGLGRYVGITRLWDGQRIVGRTESTDFIHWTKAVEVLRGTVDDQTYAMPVFCYGDVYLGLVMILRKKDDRVHCELAWSPDTVKWHRIDPGVPLIPNSDKKGDYDWGCVYAAACPVLEKDCIRLYYGANNNVHTNWRDGFLALATLRPDGFAGYRPAQADGIGTVVTKPLVCSGSVLRLTADAKGGEVRAEVLGVEGVGGRTLADCQPLADDVTDSPVKWKDGGDLSRLIGKKVRLKFQLRSARLYALGFAE